MSTVPAPVPVTYRGVEFKSTLEGRWAVFFDHLPHINTWQYEPATYKDRKSGWTYTPDFKLTFHGKTPGLVFEVKPMLPNQNYLEKLVPFVIGIREEKFDFAIGAGSFYEDNIRIYRLSKGSLKKPVRITSTSMDGFFLPPNTFAEAVIRAASAASTYRFDL